MLKPGVPHSKMEISNPIYKGVLRFGDELSPPIECLRIVSDEEFDCCEALVKGRAPERPEKQVEPIQQGSRNLLTGLIFCGYCGNRLCYSHNKTHRNRDCDVLLKYLL